MPNKEIPNPDSDHDPNAVDSMLESESQLNSLSTSSHNDKQPPIEATVQATGPNKDLSNTLVLSSWTNQKGSANGKIDTSQLDIIDGTISEGVDSGEL